jgi:hypothetical protein
MRLMKHSASSCPPLLVLSLLLLLLTSAHAQLIQVSPPHRPHTQDATVGYEPTSEEAKFDARQPDVGGENSFGAKKADTLLGKKDKLVAWFGILRERTAKGATDTWLIEHKYYDGLNDFHIQLASLFGAGDFTITAADPKAQLQRHALVRVISTVTEEKDGVPHVKPEYIRVWNLGDYTFMDYGVDASNERWVKLRQKMNLVYSPTPTVEYYEKLLGK